MNSYEDIVSSNNRNSSVCVTLLCWFAMFALIMTTTIRSSSHARNFSTMIRLLETFDDEIPRARKLRHLMFYGEMIALNLIYLLTFLKLAVTSNAEYITDSLQDYLLLLNVLIFCHYAKMISRRFRRYNSFLEQLEFSGPPQRIARIRNTYIELKQMVHLYNDIFGMQILLYLTVVFSGSLFLTNRATLYFLEVGSDADISEKMTIVDIIGWFFVLFVSLHHLHVY